MLGALVLAGLYAILNDTVMPTVTQKITEMFKMCIRDSFNLYEDTDNKWSIELVGTFSFNTDKDDWACDEVFTTRDKPFVIERESDWKSMETVCIDLVNEYLSFGKYAGKLKEYQAIGIGFVDGDLHILYER